MKYGVDPNYRTFRLYGFREMQFRQIAGTMIRSSSSSLLPPETKFENKYDEEEISFVHRAQCSRPGAQTMKRDYIIYLHEIFRLSRVYVSFTTCRVFKDGI